MAVFAVQVGVALSRPPKCDATIYCLVEAPNETKARLMACLLAASHPRVSMPVSADIVADDIY